MIYRPKIEHLEVPRPKKVRTQHHTLFGRDKIVGLGLKKPVIRRAFFALIFLSASIFAFLFVDRNGELPHMTLISSIYLANRGESCVFSATAAPW